MKTRIQEVVTSATEVEVPAAAPTVEVPASESTQVEAEVVPASESTPVDDGATDTLARITPAARVEAIRAAVLALQGNEDIPVQYKEWNGGNSFAVRLPSFKTAVKTLPESDEAKQYLACLKNTRKAVESFTDGSASQTWVFHKSGSFALYSTLG
jgi:hypothetical protein